MFLPPAIFDTLEILECMARIHAEKRVRALWLGLRLRERDFMDRKVDVLEGDVENVGSTIV